MPKMLIVNEECHNVFCDFDLHKKPGHRGQYLSFMTTKKHLKNDTVPVLEDKNYTLFNQRLLS